MEHHIMETNVQWSATYALFLFQFLFLRWGNTIVTIDPTTSYGLCTAGWEALSWEYSSNLWLHTVPYNPNTFVGLVGKVRKKLSPKGGRKGGWRKKARAARPSGPELEPGTCRVLGEGPPAARHGGCLDKQAFPCLKIG